MCLAHPDEANEILDEWAAAARDGMADRQAPRETDALRVVLRSDEDISGYQDCRVDPVRREFGDGVVEMLVMDAPTSTSPVIEAELAALGLTPAEGFARALAQTSAALGPVPAPDPNEFAAGDTCEAISETGLGSSWLCDHRAWASLAIGARGPLIATVPDRRLVYFADSGVPGALATLQSNTLALFEDTMCPLDCGLFVWDVEAGWVPGQIEG